MRKPARLRFRDTWAPFTCFACKFFLKEFHRAENRKPTLWNFLLPNTLLPTVSPLLFLDTHLEVSTSVQNQRKNGEGLFHPEVWSQWWGRGGQSEERREPHAKEFRASCLLSDKGGVADFNIFSNKFHSVWSSDQTAGTGDSSLAQQSHTNQCLMETWGFNRAYQLPALQANIRRGFEQSQKGWKNRKHPKHWGANRWPG